MAVQGLAQLMLEWLETAKHIYIVMELARGGAFSLSSRSQPPFAGDLLGRINNSDKEIPEQTKQRWLMQSHTFMLVALRI